MKYLIPLLLVLFLAALIFCAFGCVSHRFGAFTGTATIAGIGRMNGHGVIAASDATKTSKNELQDVKLRVKYDEGKIVDVKWETFSTEGIDEIVEEPVEEVANED